MANLREAATTVKVDIPDLDKSFDNLSKTITNPMREIATSLDPKNFAAGFAAAITSPQFVNSFLGVFQGATANQAKSMDEIMKMTVETNRLLSSMERTLDQMMTFFNNQRRIDIENRREDLARQNELLRRQTPSERPTRDSDSGLMGMLPGLLGALAGALPGIISSLIPNLGDIFSNLFSGVGTPRAPGRTGRVSGLGRGILGSLSRIAGPAAAALGVFSLTQDIFPKLAENNKAFMRGEITREEAQASDLETVTKAITNPLIGLSRWLTGNENTLKSVEETIDRIDQVGPTAEQLQDDQIKSLRDQKIELQQKYARLEIERNSLISQAAIDPNAGAQVQELQTTMDSLTEEIEQLKLTIDERVQELENTIGPQSSLIGNDLANIPLAGGTTVSTEGAFIIPGTGEVIPVGNTNRTSFFGMNTPGSLFDISTDPEYEEPGLFESLSEFFRPKPIGAESRERQRRRIIRETDPFYGSANPMSGSFSNVGDIYSGTFAVPDDPSVNRFLRSMSEFDITSEQENGLLDFLKQRGDDLAAAEMRASTLLHDEAKIARDEAASMFPLGFRTIQDPDSFLYNSMFGERPLKELQIDDLYGTESAPIPSSVMDRVLDSMIKPLELLHDEAELGRFEQGGNIKYRPSPLEELRVNDLYGTESGTIPSSVMERVVDSMIRLPELLHDEAGMGRFEQGGNVDYRASEPWYHLDFRTSFNNYSERMIELIENIDQNIQALVPEPTGTGNPVIIQDNRTTNVAPGQNRGTSSAGGNSPVRTAPSGIQASIDATMGIGGFTYSGQ